MVRSPSAQIVKHDVCVYDKDDGPNRLVGQCRDCSVRFLILSMDTEGNNDDDDKFSVAKKKKSYANRGSQGVTRAGILLIVEPAHGKSARVCLRDTEKGLTHLGGKCKPCDSNSAWRTAIRLFYEQTSIKIPANLQSEPWCNSITLDKKHTLECVKLYMIVIKESSIAKISSSQYQIVDISSIARIDTRIHPCFRFTSAESITTIEKLCQ